MKRILTGFLVLCLSVWIGLKISEDPGYLMFTYKKWLVEMPLWFAILALIIFFITFYFLLLTSSFLGHSARRTLDWWEKRKINRAISMTTRGLIELTEGYWNKAEKHLIHSASHSDHPLINYLAAAQAAQEQNAITRRDHYFHQAQKMIPSAEIAIGLSQAQLQVEKNQYEQALANLKHLQNLTPEHPCVLKLLQKIYLHLQNWDALYELFPSLKKLKILSSSELEILERQIIENRLNEASKKNNSKELDLIWQETSRSLQKNPHLLAVYAHYLLNHKADEQVFELIRNHLRKDWDDNLIYLYGWCKPKNVNLQLKEAENWLKKQNKNPHLLLALGRICSSNQLWGKARTYFENSLAINPCPETYAELASLLKQLDDYPLAAQYFEKGLLSCLSLRRQILP